MKITNELNNKITRCINEKYKLQINELENKKKKLIDEYSTKIADEVMEMFASNEYMKNFVKQCTYNNITKSWVKDNYTKFSNTEPNILELTRKIQTLNEDKKLEVENITIAISYERDFDGIKDIFEKFGLKF